MYWIYIYGSKKWKRIPEYGEKLKNKVIQSDEFIVKESRRYNISVLINYQQNFKNDTQS